MRRDTKRGSDFKYEWTPILRSGHDIIAREKIKILPLGRVMLLETPYAVIIQLELCAHCLKNSAHYP